MYVFSLPYCYHTECLKYDSQCIQSVNEVSIAWEPFTDPETSITRYGYITSIYKLSLKNKCYAGKKFLESGFTDQF